jgi:hypothetical protein
MTWTHHLPDCIQSRSLKFHSANFVDSASNGSPFKDLSRGIEFLAKVERQVLPQKVSMLAQPKLETRKATSISHAISAIREPLPKGKALYSLPPAGLSFWPRWKHKSCRRRSRLGSAKVGDKERDLNISYYKRNQGTLTEREASVQFNSCGIEFLAKVETQVLAQKVSILG